MANFTPGPWIIRESMTQIGKCYRVGTEDVVACGHGAALLYDDNTSLNPHRDGVQKANACLIAGAPELYVAANEAVELLLGGYTTKEGYEYQHVDVRAALDMLRAAIAKADGKQI